VGRPEDPGRCALGDRTRTGRPPFFLRHKALEVRRHPAGWAYRHRRAVALAQVAVLLTAIAGFLAFFSIGRIGSGGTAGIAGAVLGFAPLFVVGRGPARWRERGIADLSEGPAAIRVPALELQQRLPEVGFRIGELYQDRVRLDPYLVAEYGPARLVLGIWDGDAITACPKPLATAA
jgi:hypothetical protein